MGRVGIRQGRARADGAYTGQDLIMISKVGMALVATVDLAAVQVGVVFEAHLCGVYRPVFVRGGKGVWEVHRARLGDTSVREVFPRVRLEGV